MAKPAAGARSHDVRDPSGMAMDGPARYQEVTAKAVVTDAQLPVTGKPPEVWL